MNRTTTIRYAFLHALLAAGYISLVALFMYNVERIFGPSEGGGPLNIMAFLLTFVTSATVMGALVLGRPVMWYLNGKKTEAIWLLGYTVLFLALITLCVFALLAAY